MMSLLRHACSAAGRPPARRSIEALAARSWDVAMTATLASSQAFVSRMSTSNRQTRDIQQHDTQTFVTSFVDTLGPLSMHGQNRTLGAPVGRTEGEGVNRNFYSPHTQASNSCMATRHTNWPFAAAGKGCPSHNEDDKRLGGQKQFCHLGHTRVLAGKQLRCTIQTMVPE